VTIYDGSTKLGTVATGSSGAWTFTTGALATGLHAFMATAMDQAGNIGATSSGAVDVAVGSATLAGKAGSANILIGTGGSDNFYVYNTADKVSQVAGGYGIIVSSANYTLPTHVDMLEIYGNATLGTGNSDSINYLYDFSSVASTLKAGSGADSLCVYGTAGTTLTGGAGKDTFIFANKLMGQDTVTNFSAKKDVLQFNSSLFANFAAAMADAKQVGANTVFTIDGHDSVTLQNVAKTGLAASNFHFV
jgi:Ca2+-binding RTX toxin-like protein